MKLIYDNLVYCLQNYGGISTYWYELSQRFLQEQGVDISFYETGDEKNNILRKKLNIEDSQIITSRRIAVLLERFLRLPAVTSPNIFHSSYFRIPASNAHTKTVCTVHDFTHDIYYKGPRVWLHNVVKKRAINESDLIITVSKHTKKDLLKFYPEIDESKVKVVYNGVSEEFKILPEEESTQSPFFLFIGAREPYKNFDFAIKIAAAYKEFNLYVVGSPLSKTEQQMMEAHLGTRYRVFTGIEVGTLNKLYNTAFCLLYPSSYEGFGIPLLEAMRAGCPFLALHTSSIPEVAGDAGILISGLVLGEAKDAVEKITRNRNEMVQKGLSQSRKFSWNTCFEETFNLYKSLQ